MFCHYVLSGILFVAHGFRPPSRVCYGSTTVQDSPPPSTFINLPSISVAESYPPDITHRRRRISTVTPSLSLFLFSALHQCVLPTQPPSSPKRHSIKVYLFNDNQPSTANHASTALVNASTIPSPFPRFSSFSHYAHVPNRQVASQPSPTPLSLAM